MTLRGTLAPVVVGHVLKELSRYVWFTLEQGVKFTGRVISVKYQWSFLFSGAMRKAILKEGTEDFEKDYVEDSKSILAEIKEDIDITSDRDNDEDELKSGNLMLRLINVAEINKQN